MNVKQVVEVMDSCIDEVELPASPCLNPIRINNPDYGLTDDEVRDRDEFVRCYILKDFELLLMIPKKTEETDFFVLDINASEGKDSAFNTVDFQRALRPFDKYGYAVKKIMERVKDLAILHSVVTREGDRNKVYRKYEAFVDSRFRRRLLALISCYRKASDSERFPIKKKIQEVNRRILDCKKIWEQYAPWDA